LHILTVPNSQREAATGLKS